LEREESLSWPKKKPYWTVRDGRTEEEKKAGTNMENADRTIKETWGCFGLRVSHEKDHYAF